MRIPNEAGSFGKYDERCEQVLLVTKAKAAVLIIINGDRGSGFSVSFREHDAGTMLAVASMMDLVARQIRTDAREKPSG